MAALAGSLGLDSQVDALLNGDPAARLMGRVVTRQALKFREQLDKNAASYVAAAMNGKDAG
jgi:hypothetical protein